MQELHNARSTFEQARFSLVSFSKLSFSKSMISCNWNIGVMIWTFYFQVTALSNVEAKKRFEFLEAVSGTMDAHLRYFKQVNWKPGFLSFSHALSLVCWPSTFFMCRVMSCCIKWSHILIRFVINVYVSVIFKPNLNQVWDSYIPNFSILFVMRIIENLTSYYFIGLDLCSTIKRKIQLWTGSS